MTRYSYDDADRAAYDDEILAMRGAMESYKYGLQEAAQSLATDALALVDGEYDRREIIASILMNTKKIEGLDRLVTYYETELQGR